MPAPETAGVVRRVVERWHDGQHDRVDDCIAEEIPVALLYNEIPFAVMMATPADLEDFALGFSLSEGMITKPDELELVEVRPRLEGIELAMRVSEGAKGRSLGSDQQRLLPGRSGCGLCGARTLEEVVRQPPTVPVGPKIEESALERALGGLRERQSINALTGAVHAAAWASTDGAIVLVREDVGRHNALDKLIGALRRAGIDATTGFGLVTSRASYEMVTKAASAGFTLLAAISAPTALAIQLAQSSGLTLVGFARPGQHVVYSHPQRLVAGAAPT